MDGKLIYLTDKNEYIFITTMGLTNEIKDAMETDMSHRLNAKVAVISDCGTFKYISKKEMVPKIEGVELPDHAGFSESFIAELDKALNDYQQKQEHSSQRASMPHVRIEFNDINDVPHVWIDGKYISSFPDHGLVRLNLEWNADKGRIKPNHYCIEYRNGEDTNPDQYTGIANE
ncbi:hypothetical protein PS428_12585 [Lacticaseibacillus paracasei]